MGKTDSLKDPLLDHAERVCQDSVALREQLRALRKLRQLERDLRAVTGNLALTLRGSDVVPLDEESLAALLSDADAVASGE